MTDTSYFATEPWLEGSGCDYICRRCYDEFDYSQTKGYPLNSLLDEFTNYDADRVCDYCGEDIDVAKHIAIKFYEDPAHGWYRVSHTDLRSVECDISHYSYKTTNWVYLEEDSDFHKFIRAWQNVGNTYQIDSNGSGYSDSPSFIRRLANYS